MSRKLGYVQLTICSLVYLCIATRFGTDLGRTQYANGAYSNFFDIQAKAFLNGNLAVPKDSLGAEAFIVDGQEHLYFGIFPALLRMPLLVFSDSLFGHLTVVSCFAAWLLFVVSAWRLGDMVLDHADFNPERRWVRVGVPTAWRLAIALGSPMLMLAGPAWVFSEAIMWGVAAATFFQWRLLVVLNQPSARNQLWVGGALVLAVLNRSTLGLGCVLVLVALAIWRARQGSTKEARSFATSSAVAIVALTLPNMMRFGRLFGPPMQSQILSQIDEQRIRMLQYAGGDFVDPRYLPTNAVAYLRPDGVSFSEHFPFIGPPAKLPTVFLDAVHDITYRTPSLIATSTALVLLSLLGVVYAARRLRSDRLARQAVFLAAAGIPAAATLLVWGFIAPRYLADFLVLLVPLSALGCLSASRWLSHASPRRGIVAMVALAAAVLWSTVAHTALAVSSSYLTGPDGGADRLLEIQGRGDYWTAAPVARYPAVSDFDFERTAPPTPETIAILGKCEAVYFSTGEPVDPWIALAYGPSDFRREFAVTTTEPPTAGSVLVATFDAVRPDVVSDPVHFEVRVTTNLDGRIFLNFADDFGAVDYPVDAAAGDSFVLTVTSDPVRQRVFFDINGQTAHFAHYLTRSLFTDAGQAVTFSDGTDANGLRVEELDPPSVDCQP